MTSIKVGERQVDITHADRVLFPEDGLTKADVVGYYATVARAMLPYAKGHPIAMRRYPGGIDSDGFFHKQAPDHFPDYIDRADVPKNKGSTRYAVCNDPAAFAYIANQGCIEFHLLPTKAGDPMHPDRMIFDLDPSIDDFEVVRDAARLLHELLDDLGLVSYLLTSGSRGLHIWVPLNGKADVEQVLDFAAKTADALVARSPDTLTTEGKKADREEKLYVDIARNGYAQHAVAPYSLRAKAGAPVATPITWDELEDAKLTPTRYDIRSVIARLERKGDPWSGFGRRTRGLERAQRALREVGHAS